VVGDGVGCSLFRVLKVAGLRVTGCGFQSSLVVVPYSLLFCLFTFLTSYPSKVLRKIAIRKPDRVENPVMEEYL